MVTEQPQRSLTDCGLFLVKLLRLAVLLDILAQVVLRLLALLVKFVLKDHQLLRQLLQEQYLMKPISFTKSSVQQVMFVLQTQESQLRLDSILHKATAALQVIVLVVIHVLQARSVLINRLVLLELFILLVQLHQLVLLVQLEVIVTKLSKLRAKLDFIVILLLMQHSINSVLLEHTQLEVQVQLHALNVMVVKLAHRQE